MKKMKKLLGMLMCVVLALGCLTGCGEASDEDILLEAVKAVNSAESYDMESKVSGKMTVSLMGQSQAMDMTVTQNATYFKEPYKMKMTNRTSTSGQTVETESYMVKEEDNYVIYTKAEDVWTKVEMGNLEEAMASAGINSITNSLGEDIGKYAKKENRTENDKEYLVYDYTIKQEEIKKMMDGMMSSLTPMMESMAGEVDAAQIEKLMNDIIGSMGDITMTILVDKEEKSIYRIEYPMTDMMNKMMEAIIDWIGEYAKTMATNEDEIAQMETILKDMSMTVSDMNMELTYSNLNEAEDFEIPEEAKNAESASDVAA